MNVTIKKMVEDLLQSFYNGNREHVAGELEHIAKTEPLIALWVSLDMARQMQKHEIAILQRAVDYKWWNKQ